MLHIPVLRAGKPYYSLKRQPLVDITTGETMGELSLALPGQIARDLLQAPANRRTLEALPVAELIEICHRAARLFATADLPLGTTQQGPEEYLKCLAATAGMPLTMGRANMEKIVGVMAGIEDVLDGLTRGLDLSVLDGGWGTQEGRCLSYLRQTENLGAVLPNNSPGVHNLWIPAIPLKVPLVLKPGTSEPWTPYRIAAAMIEAGCPQEAFSIYPTDHGGVAEVLVRTGRSMFFGDAKTVKGWQGTGKVQLHGPGWSKVLFGADAAPHFADHIDLLVNSVAANGGRSCINASGVWTPSHGREIAEAMAEKLARIEARPLDHPEAGLAAFPDPEVARRVSAMIDQHLEIPGATEVTARIRSGSRVAEAGGCTFLLPTVIHCEDPEHPLAASEFIFPFVSVVEVPQDELFDRIGPTLIGTIISEEKVFLTAALNHDAIDRLNLGPIPTFRIAWDQPHEGNLFDHLYHQRAFQTTPMAS
jgi:acyl-CoA reductase-like NAD-dependent aldehyde dehydrogenase